MIRGTSLINMFRPEELEQLICGLSVSLGVGPWGGVWGRGHGEGCGGGAMGRGVGVGCGVLKQLCLHVCPVSCTYKEWNFEELEASTSYEGGFSSDHVVIR